MGNIARNILGVVAGCSSSPRLGATIVICGPLGCANDDHLPASRTRRWRPRRRQAAGRSPTCAGISTRPAGGPMSR
jgi:hypothetical protein